MLKRLRRIASNYRIIVVFSVSVELQIQICSFTSISLVINKNRRTGNGTQFYVKLRRLHKSWQRTIIFFFLFRNKIWGTMNGTYKFVRKGKCILKEKPFVYVLKSKYRTERCDFCFSTGPKWVFIIRNMKIRPFENCNYDGSDCILFYHSGKVLKCSGCQYVYYCNRNCQETAWANHKAECICLKRAAGKSIPDAARVLTRIILKLNSGGEEEKGYYTEKFYRKFKDLMSRKINGKGLLRFWDEVLTRFVHFIDFPDIQNDQRRLEHIEALTVVLRDMLTVDLLPDPSDLMAMYGRVCN